MKKRDKFLGQNNIIHSQSQGVAVVCYLVSVLQQKNKLKLWPPLK
jgi:hypothetical protein